jgi:hypothetical protein
MESLIVQEQAQPQIQETNLKLVQQFSIDRPDTCWFLKREEDVLAGYLFAQDYEMREGSD